MRRELERTNLSPATLAAALRSRQFKIFLQPLVDTRSGRLVAAEALIRWARPGYGLLPPAQFLPQIACAGMLPALDFFVLNEVCSLLNRWRTIGFPSLTLFVNQSREHLMHPSYPRRVAQILDSKKIDPNQIVVEFTEGSSCQNRTAIRKTGRDLQNLGIRLAADDYGAGYFPLLLLQECNLHIVKLDKSFLEKPAHPKTTFLLQNAMELIRGLNAIPLCEGVETLQQARLIQALRCPLAQGFFFAYPMNSFQFERSFLHV